MKDVGESFAAYMGCRMTARAILLVLLTTTTAHADDRTPAVSVLLANPADLAGWLREHDPQTIAAKERVVAASEGAEQARVYPNPQASAGVGNFVLGTGNPDPVTGMHGPTGLRQTTNISVGVSELFELGKRGPRRQAADLRTMEAQQSAVATLGGRLSDATTTLGKLAYVVAHRDLVAQNLEAARKLQTNEQIRVDQHDLAGIDFSRIQLETEALEVELGRSDADVDVALAACDATLFVPCSPGGLDASTLDAAAPIPAALPDAGAIQNRPVHVAQKLEAQALDEDARLADARKIPDPTVGVNYTYDNYVYGGAPPQSIALSLGIPLPLFDRGNHDAAAARANARAIHAQEQALLRVEGGTAAGLAQQLEKLKIVLHRLETESVPKAQKIVEQTRKAFDLGQSGLAELLLAEREYRDLLAQLLDTRFDLFNTRVALRQALGLDDEAARLAAGGSAR